MADTKVSALSEVSVPDLSDDLYLVDNTGPTSYKVGTDRLLGIAHIIPGGRLTLTSGTPVTTADVTAAGTLYYTPYLHNQIDIYDGTRWIRYAFTERSLSLTLTSGKNYDVFIYDNAGTLTLELSAAWTNDTTRADALTTQDGWQVKSGATTRLWLGTIRASAANQTEDSAGGSTTQVGGKRYVWNTYNQVPRSCAVIDTADSWTYTTQTIRQANAASGNKVEWVTGNANSLVVVTVCATAYVLNNTVSAKIGCGIDTTSAFSGLVGTIQKAGSGDTYGVTATSASRYSGYPGLGYHYASWNEKGPDGSAYFLGDNGAEGTQSGLIAYRHG